ncbi:aminoglycoside phosphotransferase family protein [Candidatus Saccharibacteria bacterium]|nr:aminoglycoside phosphotransferase family protein [Candidatus Saccharibacteria bacterium]
MNRFFTPQDPLEAIIQQTLKDHKVTNTKHIISGWTNIVIEVTTNKGTFFFRFPRNPFWSKMIVKDAKFCNYIEGKTSFYTPQMTLHYDERQRPFSVHTKIEGYALTDRIYHLSHTTITATAYSIAKFLKELQAIDLNTAPTEAKYPLSKFLKELDDRHYSTHLTEDHKYIKKSESQPTLVHGDFNLGNVLLNDKDEVVGIIDFCFAGIGHPHMDTSRILSRPTHPVFEETILSQFDDNQQILKMRDIWRRIDAGYIAHMRRAHPEIIIPKT